MHLPFCRISRCSHKMSPTKSGASSRKQSFPSAQRAAPFIQNFWKSTPFRLNSLTAHITQSRTWVSVHCRGSAGRDQMTFQQIELLTLPRASETIRKHLTFTEDVLGFTELGMPDGASSITLPPPPPPHPTAPSSLSCQLEDHCHQLERSREFSTLRIFRPRFQGSPLSLPYFHQTFLKPGTKEQMTSLTAIITKSSVLWTLHSPLPALNSYNLLETIMLNYVYLNHG